MSKKLEVKLIKAGVREFLLSESVQEMLQDRADQALARLGSGYSTGVYHGQNRTNISVTADTPEAIQENLKTNKVLKALDGL